MFGGYDPLSSWQVRGILRLARPGLSFSSNKRSEERRIAIENIETTYKSKKATNYSGCSASLE